MIDHGAYEYDALDDYPDFTFPCANAASNDPKSKGIILGGSDREKQWPQIESKG